MTKAKLQAGFAPLIIIAIVAVLAIGGGAYVVSKNKAKAPAEGDNAETQANANADANANANANLGVNAKGSLRSLLGLGKNVMCTFKSEAGDVVSSGTVYVAANGNMRGDFKMGANADTQSSSMMVKDGYSYVWSGKQGVKMKASAEASAQAGAEGEAKQTVNLDEQVDYSCSNWTMDASKFTLPSGVEFIDLEAMLKGGAVGPGNINLKSATEFGY
jgi:hypothetical protein